MAIEFEAPGEVRMEVSSRILGEIDDLVQVDLLPHVRVVRLVDLLFRVLGFFWQLVLAEKI